MLNNIKISSKITIFAGLISFVAIIVAYILLSSYENKIEKQTIKSILNDMQIQVKNDLQSKKNVGI